MGSGSKGFTDFILNPVGTVFSDMFGFQADPIGEMISQSFKNTGKVLSGDPIDSFFGESWIGDMVDPWLGFEGIRAKEATEANTIEWENFFAQGAKEYNPEYVARGELAAQQPKWAPTTSGNVGETQDTILDYGIGGEVVAVDKEYRRRMAVPGRTKSLLTDSGDL